MEGSLSLNCQKKHVYAVLLLIKDASDREYMNQLITMKQFLFMYNSMGNANPLSGQDIDKFVAGQTVPL